jgi:DNA-binding GntR family transcriptional regulator
MINTQLNNGVVSVPLSKEDFAYEKIREAILSGDLVAGETLVQTKIARDLGVSVIPVRAAVRRLMAERFVTQEHYHPPKVAKLAINELEETLIIREHLEILATKEAISHMTPTHLVMLKELLHELDVAIQDNDMPRFGVLNKRFHLAIYDACPYRQLVQMITDLWDKTDRSRSRTMFSMVPHLAEQSQADHHRLLEFIENGATDEAARLTDEHKARGRRLFLGVL